MEYNDEGRDSPDSEFSSSSSSAKSGSSLNSESDDESDDCSPAPADKCSPAGRVRGSSPSFVTLAEAKAAAKKKHQVSVKTKKKSGEQTFLPQYSQLFPCIQRSRSGNHFGRCTVCQIDIRINNTGKAALRDHVKTTSHKRKQDEQQSTSSRDSMRQFLKPPLSVKSPILAEVLWANLINVNNTSTNLSEDYNNTQERMYPDSDISKKFACSYTKASCIADTLAKQDQEDITEILKTTPYCLGTDGGTETHSNKKLFPLVVRYYDRKARKVVSSVLNLVELQVSSTGQNIFNLLDSDLTARGIPWENCLCFFSDNANTMKGKGVGVYGHIKRKHQSIYFMGCACHLIHLGAQAGAA